MLEYEKDLIKNGINVIAGIDEVGRGCLFGPMVVASVIWDTRNNDVSNLETGLFTEIKDSKQISTKKRKFLSDLIKERALSYSIFEISNTTLDEKGISFCTQLGFSAVYKNHKHTPHHALTDAFKIKELPNQKQTNLVKGDQKSLSIAAASIIAKVYRDELMQNLVEQHLELKKYGIDKNVGYGTKQHLDALKTWGITEWHRKSFEPIKSMIKKEPLKVG